VTIADNIPYWKLKTQLLGGEGAATDFAHVAGQVLLPHPERGAAAARRSHAVLDQDRNGDGGSELDGSRLVAA